MHSPTHYIPASQVLHYEENLQKMEENEAMAQADPIRAKLFKDRHSLRMIVGDEYRKYPLCLDNAEFGKYSIGVQMYFNFLKSTSMVFAFMALISILALVTNIYGEGLKSNQINLAIDVCTLGNQAIFEQTLPAGYVNMTSEEQKVIQSDFIISAKAYQNKMELKLFAVSIPDLLYSIVFMVFIFIFRISNDRQIQEDKNNHRSVTDFAIEVSGFPETVIDENEIYSFFTQFGQVIEARLARNYFGTLLNYTKQAKLEVKCAIEKRKNQLNGGKSAKKIARIEQKIEKLKKSSARKLEKKFQDVPKHEDYPSIKAFVIFESLAVRNQVLALYEKYNKTNIWRLITRYKVKYATPEIHQFQGKFILNVKVPDSPSNILWENIDCTSREKRKKILISSLIVVVLIFMTFLIVMGATIVQGINPSLCDSKTINFSNLDTNNELMVDCFCSNLDWKTFINNSEERSLCYSYMIKATVRYGLSIASGFVIVFVNYLLKTILIFLGKYERYGSITEETFSSLTKIFVAMFINTAIITLVMHANIFGFIPAVSLSNIIPQLHGILSDSSGFKFPGDFDRQWYVEVGGKVMVTWFINIMSPHCIIFLYNYYSEWSRKKKAALCTLQKDMNDNYMGPPFELITKYAIALNTIFVTLFYCSGMPLMLFCGGMSLFLQYWVEKTLILRIYSKPPHFDWKINEKVGKILPLALIFHLAIGIYAYGSDTIFPSSISLNDQISQTTANLINLSGSSGIIYNRCVHIVWLFAVFLIMLIFYAADISLLTLLRSICCPKKLNKIHTDGRHDASYTAELGNLAHQGLASYDIKLNTKYTNIIRAMNGLEKEEKATAVLTTKSLNNSDEEKNSLKRPSLFKKK